MIMNLHKASLHVSNFISIAVHQRQQKNEILVVQSSRLESSLVKEKEMHSKTKEERDQLQVIMQSLNC